VNKLILPILFLSFFSTPYSAFAGNNLNAASLCEMVLQKLDLDFPGTEFLFPALRTTGWVTTSKYSDDVFDAHIEAFAEMSDGSSIDANTKIAADVSYNKSKKVLLLRQFFVDPQFGNIVGHKALFRILEHGFPDVQTIVMELPRDVNYAQFKDGVATGKTPLTAAADTPLGKAIKWEGFVLDPNGFAMISSPGNVVSTDFTVTLTFVKSRPPQSPKKTLLKKPRDSSSALTPGRA
jgi:hypothetical protein